MVRYGDILDSIGDTLEDLNTSGYQWATSDHWQRARTIDAERMATDHLEFWIELGQSELQGARGLLHPTAELIVTCRYTLDDAYTSQARILNASLHAMQALSEWKHDAYQARATPRGQRIDTSNSERAALVIPFTLTICNWRS